MPVGGGEWRGSTGGGNWIGYTRAYHYIVPESTLGVKGGTFGRPGPSRVRNVKRPA